MSQDLLSKFIDNLSTSGKSASTIIAYRKDIQQLYSVIRKPLTEVSSQDLNEAISKLSIDNSFTPKTISRKLNSIRTFFKFLQSTGLISNNPAMEVSHPKLNPTKQRVLKSVEYLAIRETTRGNNRLYTLIELMLQTGIRIGEVSRLTLGDVELAETNPHLNIVAFSTNPAREVPLNQKAITTIKEHIALLPSTAKGSPLFPTRDGKPMIIRNIRSSVDRALLKAGIDDASVNDLRNTFIVAQLKAGVPIDLISRVVGHRSKHTTFKYLELLDEPYQPSGIGQLVEL